MSKRMNKALLVLKELEQYLDYNQCKGDNPTNGHENALSCIVRAMENDQMLADQLLKRDKSGHPHMINILINEGCIIKEEAYSE